MVFPSLVLNIEPGLVSQFSAMAVILFSFLINRMKKVFAVVTLLLFGIFCYQSQSHAFMAAPSFSYNYPGSTQYVNNLNYYGRPWGYAPPTYFYPQLQYQSLWGPQQQNYFNPHPLSPYSPIYNCPFCSPRPAQPQFPFPMVHPDGAAS